MQFLQKLKLTKNKLAKSLRNIYILFCLKAITNDNYELLYFF